MPAPSALRQQQQQQQQDGVATVTTPLGGS
jgi:hypothetical protein